jgi:hypothetical protein
VDNSITVGRNTSVLTDGNEVERNWRMNLGKQKENKWKKALFGAAIGTIGSAVLACSLYVLSGQALYLAIIGLGAGIGFSIGGGLDNSTSSD